MAGNLGRPWIMFKQLELVYFQGKGTMLWNTKSRVLHRTHTLFEITQNTYFLFSNSTLGPPSPSPSSELSLSLSLKFNRFLLHWERNYCNIIIKVYQCAINAYHEALVDDDSSKHDSSDDSQLLSSSNTSFLSRKIAIQYVLYIKYQGFSTY